MNQVSGATVYWELTGTSFDKKDVYDTKLSGSSQLNDQGSFTNKIQFKNEGQFNGNFQEGKQYKFDGIKAWSRAEKVNYSIYTDASKKI